MLSAFLYEKRKNGVYIKRNALIFVMSLKPLKPALIIISIRRK